MPSIKMKRGDTFARTGTYLVDGEPVSLADIDVQAQVRRAGSSQVWEFSVEKLPQSGDTLGMYALLLTYDVTATFPIEDLYFDVQFTTEDGDRSSSETITLKVREDVTR